MGYRDTDIKVSSVESIGQSKILWLTQGGGGGESDYIYISLYVWPAVRTADFLISAFTIH